MHRESAVDRSEMQRALVSYGIALALIAVLLWVAFEDALRHMAGNWFGRPEYSHGMLIPFIAAFLAWQRWPQLPHGERRGSWAGVAVVGLGALLHVVGQLSTLYVIQQYALLVIVYGLVLSYVGWPIFRRLWVPLLLLVFMIPLPEFLYRNFSAQLQLLSSQIGVAFIRLMGISVHLEGNVIDLGHYKLQVAEACDGLRYLFPLMTLGFVMAQFYRAPLWKKAVVFLSSIPITILMNSFRVGMIGVMVRHWGVGMAEGFLHEFQGWVVFMASTALMLALMALLGRTGGERLPWREVFSIELPRRGSHAAAAAGPVRAWVPATVAALALFAVHAAATAVIPERAEVVPPRPSFATFPDRLGPWSGRTDSLDPVYLQVLRLSDYYIGDFTRGDEPPVNLYVAWYDSQRSGQSAHSPRSCLPGGGWRIEEFATHRLAGVAGPDGDLVVNRALISHGRERQVVYYWFRQRGRSVTNEYLVKGYLVWDSMMRRRSDGALIRLSTGLRPGEDPGEADRRLVEFAANAVPRLAAYVPD